MTKLMEEGDYIIMRQQGWLRSHGGRKIGLHTVHWGLRIILFQKMENCRVGALAIPRMKIKIEMTLEWFLRLRKIIHCEQPNIRMPSIKLVNLFKAKRQQLLIDF